MRQITQSEAYTITFLALSSSDGATPVTGLASSWTQKISKAGGAFADIAGTIAEIGLGWYKVELSTSETNTPGDLIVDIQHASIKPWRDQMQVRVAVPDVNVASVDEGVTIDANIVSEDAGYTPSDATLATATKQSIADYVLTRTAAEVRTAGLFPGTEALRRQMLLGAIFNTSNVVYISGGNLITEDEQGNTYTSRTAATNASAEPITGLTVPA